MNINVFLKSVIDADNAPVVICDRNHIIVYMNPKAVVNYQKYGGASLVGKSIFDCHNPRSKEMIEKVAQWFEKDENNNRVFTFHNEKHNKDVYMIALRDENKKLIGYYEKHEFRNPEQSEKYQMN